MKANNKTSNAMITSIKLMKATKSATPILKTPTATCKDADITPYNCREPSISAITKMIEI